MNVKIKYLSGYLNFKIPKKIKVINSLPDEIIQKLDRGAMRNILNKGLMNNINLNCKNKKIAIIIEDITRPVYLGEIVKILIEELMKFGAKSSSVTIISATGAHRFMKQNDFEQKIGNTIASTIRCISNDCENGQFKYLGIISKGIPLYINEDVVNADIKITIGTVFPHDMAGFSGGAKIILPGVSSLKTIEELHRLNSGIFVYGKINGVGPRYIIEEAGDIVGIDLSINLIINQELQIISISAGNFRDSQRKAAIEFSKIYKKSNIEKTDIVISNCYPLGSDLYQVEKGLFPALFFANHKAKILLISGCEEGVGFQRIVDENGILRKSSILYFEKLSTDYDISFYSTGLKKSDCSEYFKYFKFFNNLDDSLSYLFNDKESHSKSLSLLKASPLILPN